MEILNNIIGFFKNPVEENRDCSPREMCTLCWGYQEYDRKVRKVYPDRQIDVNNHSYKYMRIQKLLKEQIEGIKLKKAKIYECRMAIKKSTKTSNET